jgi:hypothetical protein
MSLFRLIGRPIARGNLTPKDLERLQRAKEERGCKTPTVVDGDRHMVEF